MTEQLLAVFPQLKKSSFKGSRDPLDPISYWWCPQQTPPYDSPFCFTDVQMTFLTPSPETYSKMHLFSGPG